MEIIDTIFGCYLSYPQMYFDASQEEKDLALEQGELFKSYIWGDKGICYTLKKLKHEDYGKDLKLALFQFYVKPLQIPMMLQALKGIERYRPKEKSIGIPIVVNDENFFNKSEEERYHFLKQSILQKLDLPADVVKRRKLDTNMEQLKFDLQKLLD